MDYYYAVFEKTDEAIEVYFPDIENAVTFGDTWEEAHRMAVDVLAATLSVSSERPKRTELDGLIDKHDGKIMAIPVDEKIIQKYEASKRVNVIFPISVLNKIDEYRGKHSLKRSELLSLAVNEYINLHP